MTFRVGQKVVCVDGAPSRFTGCPSGVSKGGVYTVTAFWITRLGNRACLLQEAAPWSGHSGFDAARFRPIVERKTDISVFEEILRSVTAPEFAEVRHG